MLMKIAFKTVTSRLGFFAMGAAAMYLNDPDRGHARRAELLQRSESMSRRMMKNAVRRAEKEERDLMNRLEGVMASVRGGGRFHPESEVDLREHLRQVIRSMRVPGDQVNVDVCAGTVTLRGQVPDEDARGLVLAAVGSVEGVVRVQDYTHLPGELAPNKAAVLNGIPRRRG
jgi:hypothetical protein